MQPLNKALFEYYLRIGDTCLVLGHRLSEWCGHGPMLEEDIAMANMALDLTGQAELMLSYASDQDELKRSADELAFLRDVLQYRNVLLAEQPNGDFAVTMMRQFLISIFNEHLYRNLTQSKNKNLAAFAEKSLKEVIYHVRHSSGWVLRLGNGTEESHERAQNALNDLWIFTDDLFDSDNTDKLLMKEKIAADPDLIREKWIQDVKSVLIEAGLTIPEVKNFMRIGGKQGRHTEHLGYLLAEMQFLPRAYPGTAW